MISSRGGQTLALAVLAIAAFTALLPVSLMLLNAFKSASEITASPLALPVQWRWDNFTHAWTDANLGSSLLHSAEVALSTVALVLASATPCAYVIARRRIRYWRALSFYFLATITFPVQLYLFPLYFGFAKLGLVNSIPAVALIYCAMYSPFAIFLLRTYVLAIPESIEEAAAIDGATPWQSFRHVVLPLLGPGLLTVSVIIALYAWNEFIIAVTFLQNSGNVTAIVKFYALAGQYSSDWGEMMAAASIIVIPVVAVFVVLQKRFIDGMAAGSVKA